MQTEYSYTLATESELNELLVGKQVGLAFQWPGYGAVQQPSSGSTGVLSKRESDSNAPIRPVALVVREDEIRRLCGRFAQLRSDLSPLTAWCHLLTPQRFALMESPKREARLGGLEAAWTGLIVAEAQLLSEKSLGTLRFPACLATQSFAICRAKALWPDSSVDEIGKRFEFSNRLFKTESGAGRSENRTARVRLSLQPIWASLCGILQFEEMEFERDLQPIIASLSALRDSRARKDKREVEGFVRPLLGTVPEAQVLSHIAELAAEERLKVFDLLVHALNSVDAYKPSLRRNALALLAGYLATVAAGGTPSLTLAENTSLRWPEITAWAYVVGGIGEAIVWTSSFDGLGRFVSRELMRPFRMGEAPTCDLALDEALVLIDPKLSDPLVHLRIKQAKIATVALLPGVNIAIAIGESTGTETKQENVGRGNQDKVTSVGRDFAVAIAEAVWPHLRPRVEEYINSKQGNEFGTSSRRGKRKTSQGQLPLKNSQQ